MNDFFTKIEPIKKSNSMFLHPSPDIDIKVIKQIGDYSLGAELGSGAFGKVVLGRHILTNELVAIKILDKMILSHTPDDYQSVKQEINILKSVKHKHIVQLYEVLQTSQHIFIIMEYCEGKDLLDYILTKSKLSEEESLKYFQQLINALFYLHSQNIAHRDIKIDNMLLDRNRDLKLVDFGLSTKYPDDNLLDQPCGTVVYAAPEVLQGREYHGMLADVWSSGIVLYGMLSGYLPFGEQDDEINRQNIIMGKIKFPNYFSDCVKDLLMHMLDLDPMTRYTLQEVRSHQWFNLIDYKLIPGIIIGYNKIPVDERILNICVTYNFDKEKVRESVINNKYNSESALYYLIIKKLQKKGFHSVSDFCSDEFINFVLDDNNLIEVKSSERNMLQNNYQESEIKYNVNINANKNCSAPPDGKQKYNQEKNRENSSTPKNSDFENINKRINFEESPRGVLSFIINTPSFEETNKEIFNVKTSLSNNKITRKFTNNNNDDESKKTNKNTSSDSKQRNIVYQIVNVNDFQITDGKINEKPVQKIINESELEKNLNSNNIYIDENNQNEIENDNDYKMLNVIYNNTDNNEKSSIKKEKGYMPIIIKNKNNIFDSNINDSNNLNLTDNNNIIDNSIEIIYDKTSERKNRNNADILETPIINDDNISQKLISLDKNIKNEFIIETPPNKDKIKNKETIEEEKNTSKNKNTLSKQKVYIDKKTYSEKNKSEENNKLDINKIKDIRKINLFQDEIKEENYKVKKDEEKLLLHAITERELNNKLDISQQKSKSNRNRSNISLNKNESTPITKKIEQISSLYNDSNRVFNNINNDKNEVKENNKNELIKDISLRENEKDIEDINDNKIIKENLRYDNQNNNNNKISEDNLIKEKQEENNKEANNKNINAEKEEIKILEPIKDVINIEKEIAEKNGENKEEKIKESKEKSIEKSKEKTIEQTKEKSIEQIKEKCKEKSIERNKESKEKSIEKSKEKSIEKNKEKSKQKSKDKNKEKSKDKNNEKSKDKNNTTINKAKKNPKNKVVKKKDINKKKNPIISSIIKNYKAIIDNNKTTEMKKKSISKEKNKNTNCSSKTKLSEKEIISIKVMINQNLLSKEKNKYKNTILKTRTEQQERKIKSIYRVNLFQNNLSKSKYSAINKKPTVSIFKSKLKKNYYTNKKPIKNKFINSTHIKSSSIHIFGTMAKNEKLFKKNMINTTTNSNSLFKINNLIKSKNKQVTSSNVSSKSKKAFKNNFLVKSYNNKYMKLFKSTQYKNNNILFTNKIDKTNLNKKFDEIAHKINKNSKKSKNKYEEKKIPLWKYIQSDQQINQNNKKIVSPPHISKKDIIKGNVNKIININKNIKDKIIMQNSYENKNNDTHLEKNLKLRDNIFNNINKLNNINNKSVSLSKDKNINVFFINIKNYINNKNGNNSIKRENKNYIESSPINQRYRSPYEVRELSESMKNRLLNQKTRYTKIPWKIKKKALDEKIEIGDVYKYYIKNNKNPFKKNNKKINKKVYNIKPVNNNIKNNRIIDTHSLYLNALKRIKLNCNKQQNIIPTKDKINLKNYQNLILINKRKEITKSNNKKYNQSYTPQYIHKKSFFSTFNNLNQRNIFPNKLFHSINNYTINNNNNVLYKNNFSPLDLSCVFMKSENINECYRYLIDKLIKKNIYFVQKPNKMIRCFKNGLCCEIEIVKIEDNNNKSEKNVYCFKLIEKNGNPVNKIFKNLIFYR